MKKIWQKSDSSLHPLVEQFTVGKDYILDMALVPYDVLGSRAHAKAIHKAGVLTDEELAALNNGFDELVAVYEKGEFEITVQDEDCHAAIEKFLIEHVGPVGKKIHTGRSRNDQVLTALRLYINDKLKDVFAQVESVQASLLARAKKEQDVQLVGHTHTQPAMPSTFGLWFASFAEQLADDMLILKTAMKLNDQNPLGTAAGYGPSVTLDRELTTSELGFGAMQINPIAAQNSRGKIDAFALHALSQIMLTIGRLANDMIWFSHPSLGYVSLPHDLGTGSSIMPQKHNPDALELLRANVSIALGYERTIIEMTKNLFSGYNRDMQFAKEPLMNGFQLTHDSLEIMQLFVERIDVNEQIDMLPEIYAADQATKTAIETGVPFRDAYADVGSNKDYTPVAVEKKTIGSADNLSLEKIQQKWS